MRPASSSTSPTYTSSPGSRSARSFSALSGETLSSWRSITPAKHACMSCMQSNCLHAIFVLTDAGSVCKPVGKLCLLSVHELGLCAVAPHMCGIWRF